ncbi:hypothetical protein HK096_011171 [Nowakowskiella sp. JEL0078]|nr:hypothetical protein HK096_011171 [Nowakowskiella sp. JEL0078]
MPSDSTCCSDSGYCDSGYTCAFSASEDMCWANLTMNLNLPATSRLKKADSSQGALSLGQLLAIVFVGLFLIIVSLIIVIWRRRRMMLKREIPKNFNVEEVRDGSHDKHENALDDSINDLDFMIPAPPPIQVPGRPYVMYPKFIQVLRPGADPNDPNAPVVLARAVPVDEATNAQMKRNSSLIEVARPASWINFVNQPQDGESSESDGFEYPVPLIDNGLRSYSHIKRNTVEDIGLVPMAGRMRTSMYFAEDSDGDSIGHSSIESTSNLIASRNKITTNQKLDTSFYVADDSLNRTKSTSYFVDNESFDSVLTTKKPISQQNLNNYSAENSIDRPIMPILTENTIGCGSNYSSGKRIKFADSIKSTALYFAEDSLSRNTEISTLPPTSYFAENSIDRPVANSDANKTYFAEDSLIRSKNQSHFTFPTDDWNDSSLKDSTQHETYLAYDSIERPMNALSASDDLGQISYEPKNSQSVLNTKENQNISAQTKIVPATKKNIAKSYFADDSMDRNVSGSSFWD